MPRAKRKQVLTARTADRRALYERAVQTPEHEVAFVRRVFRKVRGRDARTLREDFCGTAVVCFEWAKRSPLNTAIGVDLDPGALAWADEHHRPRHDKEVNRRVRLLRSDVRHPRGVAKGVDVVQAGNFSSWVFNSRPAMLEYYRSVRRSLVKDGLFILDAYGGWAASKSLTERRRYARFTYVWEQASYNPITGDYVCHIHFEFKDGTKLRRAFTYRWRLWTLPEMRELLEEAGFRRSTVYWEGDDGKGGGNGVFRPSTRGEDCASFICYIVAEK